MAALDYFHPDGLHLPSIKLHSLEKIRLHNYYASLFAGGIKRWRNLAYIGLYSGAGAARVEQTGEVVQTSALAVLTQKNPFTRYIFVDESTECIEALERRVDRLGMSDRVTLLHSNVNQCTHAVLTALPDWRKEGGVLTFCFIDPFKIDLDFSVIRRLSHLRIDILLMIPLGYDVRRNWKEYIDRAAMQERLTRFLGDPDWVAEWNALERPYTEFPRFVQGKLNTSMEALGFMEQESRDIRDVKVAGKNVYLYSLHLFSKSEAARKFWRTALRGTSDQHSLDL